MKITKFVHSCLLVETSDRSALFDPGMYSANALSVDQLDRLDDIFITHVHPDHCSPDLIKQLVAKFPEARITSNSEVVAALAEQGIKATIHPPIGVAFFNSPHESIAPKPQPEQLGFHYLDSLSHPGDSHSFTETRAILALPITAPWGTTRRALALALELKPRFVLPIHDWSWNNQTRIDTYNNFENLLGQQGITLYKPQTGVPIEVPT